MYLPSRSCHLPIMFAILALLAGACEAREPIQVIATVTVAPPTRTPEPTPTVTPSPTLVPYHDTLVIGLSREPRTLNPLISDDADAFQILDAIYERYITSIDFSYQANPNGGLMTNLPTLENGGATLDDGGTPNEPIDDQLTLTFRMIRGPAWCDGTPVTATDSVYAFNLANDPDSGIASRAMLEAVESYTALDADTVQVRLKPGQLEQAYAAYFWSPLPAHIWSKYSALELQSADESNNRLCGYGPYTIAGAEEQGAGWNSGDSITLVANPHYFRGTPRTQRLIFKFIDNEQQLLAQIMTGQLDIVTADALQATELSRYTELAADGAIRVVTTRSMVWEQLIFNLNAPTTFDSTSRAQPHPILSDVRVRQAIAHAVDRQTIIDDIYAGHSAAINQPLTYHNHPLHVPEDQISLYAFDPDRARNILESAGWIDTDDDGVRECRGCTSGASEGERLALTYHTTSSALRERIVEQITGDLTAVGFEIDTELLPTEVFFGDVTGLIVGDFELGQLAALSDIDPMGERQYACEWIPTPDNGWYGENYSGWCNETASDALFTASQSLRVDERRAAYTIFQREYSRELPGLPLVPRLNVFIVNRLLENFAPNDFMPSVTWNAYELAVLIGP